MTRITCPRCQGQCFVVFERDGAYQPEDCPLRCELGWHSLPLRFSVALRDVYDRGLLAEFYDPDAIPDFGDVAA